MTCLSKAGMPALACANEAVTTYPSMISRAITMLDEDPFLRALPRNVWGVLFRLIKKVDVNELRKPIFASRETLAREAGESIPNLSRQLRALEESGVITRTQRARSGLKGSSSEIVFTDKAIRALRLDLPPPGELTQTVKKRTVDAEGRVGYQDTGLVRSGTFRIPSELMGLIVQGGMRDTAVLRLMKVARQAGQKLSDVVSGLGDRIAGLVGRQLFAYLSRACNGYRDFAADKAQAEKIAYERAQRDEEAREQQRVMAEAEKLEQAARTKKAQLLASLSAEELERLRRLWDSTRNAPAMEPGRMSELLFKTWLRGQPESILFGSVDNLVHTSYQK